MATAKSERLLNLLIMLLVARRPLTKARIRSALYADAASEASFEKMFERDKDDLRELGVPVEAVRLDENYGDEVGYRVPEDDLALPSVELEPDEAAVVGVATKVWEHARLAGATSGALTKLRTAGVEVDETALEVVEPRLTVDEPSFDAFWEATTQRREVSFTYARPDGTSSRRSLQPWGVVRFSGRWYAVGLDTDRGEERVFRLSRVVGKVGVGSRARAFEVPPGTDLHAVAARLAPARERGEATLLLRRGAGHLLRRAAARVEEDVAGPDGPGAPGGPWDRVVVPRTDLADDVLAHGADVVVEHPAELRDEVVSRLRELVAAGEGAP